MKRATPKKKPLTERERVEQSFKATLARLDRLERDWFKLPAAVRDQRPDLERWFEASPHNPAKK